MEGFGVVSGQGNYKEGANTINVRIWVDGAVLEYDPCCVAKPPGKHSTTYRNAGGAPGCRHKGKYCVGNSMREIFEGGLCKEGC